MDDQPSFINPKTLRKRKATENETSDQHKKHHTHDRKNKRRKLTEETTEQHETKLSKERERIQP
ncbi:14984_t:CDS:2 [Funneliformis geosporum]|nr:14984_t:CDS:2 [Funneliformis geosporum]